MAAWRTWVDGKPPRLAETAPSRVSPSLYILRRFQRAHKHDKRWPEMARPWAAWHGGEMTAMVMGCTEAYRALLACKAGAVR